MLKIELSKYAEIDVLEANAWYNQEVEGLGDDFISFVDTALQNIAKYPLICPVLVDNIRKKLTKKHPFAIFFEVWKDKLFVHGILHTSRDPETLTNRL